MRVLQQITSQSSDIELIPLETISDDELANVKSILADTYRIRWRGSLKEFAELITELENKGWIDPINHGEVNAFTRSILSCFDFSETQKKIDSKTEASLMQYLKPSERETKIYSKRYIKKFASILFNHPKK